jgi:hypothetical protein
MNVESSNWASVLSKTLMPLSPALRLAFAPSGPVPSEFHQLLGELDRRPNPKPCRKISATNVAYLC